MESGEDVVVGVNRFESTEPNPLTADLDVAIMVVDPAVEAAAREAVRRWRAGRRAGPVEAEQTAAARAAAATST
jgi:(2R)-ethylmalonyl-CoA mutase